jgi:predicted aspartyl protease
MIFPGANALAEDQKDCKLERFAEMPITTLPDGRFTVPVTLQGQTLDFLVDTGGVTATIDPEQVFNFALDVKYTGSTLQRVAGITLNSYTIAEKFSLGRLQGHNIQIYVDSPLPAGVDGTLSADMMQHYDVDIDMAHGVLNLFSQQHCRGQVVYWTRTGYVALPMRVRYDGHIEVPVIVDGTKFNALLDTGARYSIISMRAAKLLGVSETSPDLKLTSDKDTKYKRYDYPFKLLDFDGVAVSTPRLQIVSDNFLPGKDTDLIVGVSVLRRLHLYIAYGEEKLYITPALAN